MKALFTKFVILTILLSKSLIANAYDFEVDGIYYNVVSYDDMTCSITYQSDEYNSYKEATVSIPAEVTYNGRTFCVSEIGSYAFCKCSNLKKVVLPETIETIGLSAFEECENLEQINLPNSIFEIGSCTFYNCKRLSKINIPCYVSRLGNCLFYGCEALKELTIPAKVKALGRNVFQNSGVERCIIEDSDSPITMRGTIVFPSSGSSNGTFLGSKIKYLYLGRNFTIEHNSSNYVFSPFYWLTSLEEIVIGSKVTELPANSFVKGFVESSGIYGATKLGYMGIPNLKKLTVLDSPNELKLVTNIWGKWVGDGGIVPVTETYIADFEYVKSVILERNVRWGDKTVGSRLDIFERIEDAKLIKNFTTVNEYLFKRCKNLKTVELGDNVKTICDQAFNGEEKIKSLTLTADVPPVFYGTPNFSYYTIVKANVYVPANSEHLYKTANVWKNFQNIKAAGIEGITSDDDSIAVSANDGDICVLNKSERDVVQVYSIQGTLLAVTTESKITNLPIGLYIVTVGAKSFKISLQ